MKRTALICIPALALFALGAQAQTPSNTQQQQQPNPQQSQQGQQGQQGAQQARPTPKPASSKQIAQCNAAGSKVLGNLKNGHFSKASGKFESKLGVDKDKLQGMWKQMTDKFGNLKSMSKASQGRQIQGYTVVGIPVTFDKAHLVAQVACDSKGSLADLRFGRLPGSKPSSSNKS